MRKKIFYMLIACLFAFIVSMNNISLTSQVSSKVKITNLQNPFVKNENKDRKKVYASIILNKIEPVKKIVFRNRDRDNSLYQISFESSIVEKQEYFDYKVREKIFRYSPPYNTILYRDNIRVLRI